MQLGDKYKEPDSPSPSKLTFSGFPKKEMMRCLLCGGKDCSKCGLEAYKKLENPAIKCLHSHWITDYIVAMQRPNDQSFIDGALVDMIEKNITAVFNLTEPGEHPYCGCGVIHETGFPYNPQILMDSGIKHFNYSWRDMKIPTLDTMMNIVYVAVNEIKKGGKIAVHCHAGFGRTGITIACILIAYESLEPDKVVQFIRTRRPGSIQTTAQEGFVLKFARYYKCLLQMFPVLSEDSDDRSNAKGPTLYLKTITQSVQDQHYTLDLSEIHEKQYYTVHKLLFLASSALANLSEENFSITCLAITGLTKLMVKNPNQTSLDVDNEDPGAVRSDNVVGISSKLLRKKSSFMVATNSLSESSEETLLIDIKTELNVNKWTRIKSVLDIVSTRTTNMKGLISGANQKSHVFSTRNSSAISSANKTDSGAQRHPSSDDSKIDGTGVEMGKNENSKFVSGAGFHGTHMDHSSAYNSAPNKAVQRAISLRSAISNDSNLHEHELPLLSSKLKQNSLRANTDPDYLKSKKISANVVAQILLDWLETRKDSIFTKEIVDHLMHLWRKKGISSPQENDHDHKNPALESIKNQSSFQNSFHSEFEPDLYHNISKYLIETLDRFRFSALTSIILMYRSIRQSAQHLTNMRLADSNIEYNPQHGSDAEALDALVGLRLAIACMHARKGSQGLIRRRSLTMDLVKMFLLKGSNSEIVIINNITFSEDTYEQIKANIGEHLLSQLDVLFRTLRILTDGDWPNSHHNPLMIRWRSFRNSIHTTPRENHHGDENQTKTSTIIQSSSKNKPEFLP